MSFEIFHQLGFRYQWNIESLVKDDCGNGLIIAPRYMSCDYVTGLGSDIIKKSIFDPQFFAPGTTKGSLDSYPFFPNVAASGFETVDFTDNHASDCALRCVEYQNENQFQYVVIPARYYEGAPKDFIDQQEGQFVIPFLDAIRKLKVAKPVLLQLVINDWMLKDSDYISDILNWVTGLKIDGVYLITEKGSSSKQVKDADFLLALFDVITSLKDNGLDVVLGYLNTESLLLSLASPDVLTIGAYENMRSFKIGAFKETEPIPRGPNPRLYMSKLMQWVEYPYVSFLRRLYPDGEIFDETKYKAEMFVKEYKWHFTKPELYKHHFVVISQQLRELSKVNGKERYNMFCTMAESAITLYNELSEKGVAFDHNSDGSHLHIWLTVANLYATNMGWR